MDEGEWVVTTSNHHFVLPLRRAIVRAELVMAITLDQERMEAHVLYYIVAMMMKYR